LHCEELLFSRNKGPPKVAGREEGNDATLSGVDGRADDGDYPLPNLFHSVPSYGHLFSASASTGHQLQWAKPGEGDIILSFVL